MEDSIITIPCPRCLGKGIIYVGVHNGSPVPAHPDNGVCWKCLGHKTIDVPAITPAQEAYLADLVRKYKIKLVTSCKTKSEARSLISIINYSIRCGTVKPR